MRVFLAYRFDERQLNKIDAVKQRLADHAIKGRFTKKDNLHITIHYLGEVEKERLSDIRSAVKTVKQKPFTIRADSIGSFEREQGSIFYLHVDPSKQLRSVYRQTAVELEKRGFGVPERSYRPHITLARKAKLERHGDFDIRPLSIHADKIYLMESKHVNDQLVYEPVFSMALANNDIEK